MKDEFLKILKADAQIRAVRVAGEPDLIEVANIDYAADKCSEFTKQKMKEFNLWRDRNYYKVNIDKYITIYDVNEEFDVMGGFCKRQKSTDQLIDEFLKQNQ